MFEYFVAGAGLRLAQSIIYASVWIVVGCFISAIFRRMMGPEKVRKLFANNTRWGLLVGWLIGMLLPVCSLGVIPVVRELNRARVNQGTIVAFGLTAPLFNPMSVLYGLTLSDPIAILSFSLCALVVVSILGMGWNRFLSIEQPPEPKEPLPSIGIRRSIAVLFTACRELAGPSCVYLLIGILASVALAVSLEKGYLQEQVERDNLYAPVTVALVATPVYSTPLLAMSQIGGMFQHGNSIGAAFSLLVLGAGANIGLLAWFGVTYGFKRVALFWLLLMVITVALAYGVDKPLTPDGIDPAGHTHAFDVYTHPFGTTEPNLFRRARTIATDFWNANEFGATFLLGFMVLTGIVVTFVDRAWDLENWYSSGDDVSKKGGLDFVLPGWVLGCVSVAGLVAASVVGCYLYYPAQQDLFPDMEIINTECVLSSKNGEWDAAEKWIGYADDLSRRLEVGLFLRTGTVDDFIAAKARVYREELDRLKEMVESEDTAKITDQGMEVLSAYRRLKAACQQ